MLIMTGAYMLVSTAVSLVQDATATRRYDALVQGLPPARIIVCRTTLAPGCPAEAARRSELPVAWMEPPKGFHLNYVSAVGPSVVPTVDHYASEYLSSSDVDLDLETQPYGPWQPGNEQLLASFVEGRTAVEAYRDLYDYAPTDPLAPTSLTLRWQANGLPYELHVSPHELFHQMSLYPADYAAMVGGVRYAFPALSASSPGASSSPLVTEQAALAVARQNDTAWRTGDRAGIEAMTSPLALQALFAIPVREEVRPRTRASSLRTSTSTLRMSQGTHLRFT